MNVTPAGIPVQSRPRRFRLVAALLIFAIVALAVDAIFLEPNWIQVNHYSIQGPVTAPLKIAHLTDIHTGGFGYRERKMLAILEQEKPDVIVVTGDTLSSLHSDYANCRKLYEKLHAPLGVWVVVGNWENERPARREHFIYEAAGVHLLVNASRQIRPDVWLIGLDDPWTGTPKLDAALQGVPQDAYKIALFHSPFFFDRASGRVNLCLAGHTHGGQVKIPFIRPYWLPSGCGRFLEGWYVERESRMYVSRGLGMSNLPVRFHCRPEIVFITVQP
jgi:predicted MPP superfamily phosphohydrolase